jgi:hypothetical protein
MSVLWISTPAFTCQVTVSNTTQRVIKAAPILKWAVGETYLTLFEWLAKWGARLEIEELKDELS